MTRGCSHGQFSVSVDQDDGSVAVTCGVCGDENTWTKGVLQRGFVHKTASEQFGPKNGCIVADLVMKQVEEHMAASGKRVAAYIGSPTHLLLHFGLEVEEPRIVCLECMGDLDRQGFAPVTVDEFITRFSAIEDEESRLRWFFCVVCERGVVRVDPKTLNQSGKR